jgi:hypothetical protein
MPFNEEDLLERQRRIDAAIARAKAAHMSNAKWRKLFQVLSGRGFQLRWKFIGDDRVFEEWPPHEDAILDDCLGDVLPYPYGPYREIDWIEIPAEHADLTEELLDNIGRFPKTRTEFGLRVAGYSWP